MHIIGGLIGVVVGILLVKYSFFLTESLGRFELAEKYLGSGMGGTYTFYRLFGVIVIILSFLYMFGTIGLILGPLANVFGGVRQSQ
jgi:hypothetical protein